MRPDELVQQLTSLAVAADLVEAIDEPSQLAYCGWDLSGWAYDFVPWGVRFLHRDPEGRVTAAVVAVTMLKCRPTRFARNQVADSSWSTTLLMLE